MKFNSVFFVCAIAYVANLSAAEDLPVARALAPYFEAVANVANLNQQAVAVQDPVAVAAPEALQAENDDVDMGLPNQENNQNDAEAPLFLVLPNDFVYHTPDNQVNENLPALFGEDDLVMEMNDLDMNDGGNH